MSRVQDGMVDARLDRERLRIGGLPKAKALVIGLRVSVLRRLEGRQGRGYISGQRRYDIRIIRQGR